MQDEMCRNFGREFCMSLYMNPAESDVCLNVTTDENSFTIPGHSLVLSSQNPVFRVALDNGDNFVEGREKEIDLKVRSPRTAEYFLRFQYCGFLPESIYLPDLMELTEMAHMYQNTDLLKCCNERLERIDIDLMKKSACEMYEFASLLGLKNLQAKCKEVINTYHDYIWKAELFFPLFEQNMKEESLIQYKLENSLSAETFWKKWVFCTSKKTADSLKLNTATKLPANNPCSEMPKSLSSLCLSTYRSDMELLVDGDLKFPAHSLILMTQSDVIKTQFLEIKEYDKNCLPQIALKGVDRICSAHLLRYLYTGFLSEGLPAYNLVKLLKVALIYKMDKLQAICEPLLKSKISTKNVCILLHFAEQYHVDNLSRACINSIKSGSISVSSIFYNQLHFVLDQELLEILISSGSRHVCPSDLREPIFEWGKWRAAYETVEFEKETLEKIFSSVAK